MAEGEIWGPANDSFSECLNIRILTDWNSSLAEVNLRIVFSDRVLLNLLVLVMVTIISKCTVASTKQSLQDTNELTTALDEGYVLINNVEIWVAPKL